MMDDIFVEHSQPAAAFQGSQGCYALMTWLL
jgi:hypothetical protein